MSQLQQFGVGMDSMLHRNREYRDFLEYRVDHWIRELRDYPKVQGDQEDRVDLQIFMFLFVFLG